MNLGQISCIGASIFTLRGAQQGREGGAYKPMAHVASLLSVLCENIVDKERTGINGITRAEP